MTTQQVADRLVQLCREGKNTEAIEELYAEGVISKEPKGADREITQGIQAVKEKTIQWENSLEEIHSSSISEPLVSKDHFSIVMDFDATYKGFGRMAISEICVYEVQNGKIVADEFFYRIG
jgi:hypothetical protein